MSREIIVLFKIILGFKGSCFKNSLVLENSNIGLHGQYLAQLFSSLLVEAYTLDKIPPVKYAEIHSSADGPRRIKNNSYIILRF